MSLVLKSIKQGYYSTKKFFITDFSIIQFLYVLFLILLVKSFFIFRISIEDLNYSIRYILFSFFYIYVSRLFYLIFYNSLRKTQTNLFSEIKYYFIPAIFLFIFDLFYYLYNDFVGYITNHLNFTSFDSGNILFSFLILLIIFFVFLLIVFMRINIIIYYLDNNEDNFFKNLKNSFFIIKNNFVDYLKFIPIFIILEGFLTLIFSLMINNLNSSVEIFFIKIFFMVLIYPIYIFYHYLYLFFIYNITSYPPKENISFINDFLIVK